MEAIMISAQEARAVLKEAEGVARHSGEVYGYSLSAPYCFIWGVGWFVGYMGLALFSLSNATWIWLAVLAAGAAACALVGRSQARRGVRSVRKTWLLFVVLYAFSFCMFAIFGPVGPMQIAAYWPLLWAGVYAGVGLWLGIRYIIVAAVLAALTLLCFFHFRDYFYAAMAFAGGGSLILTGFWLRRV
jgi:hypothetical protein